jgi:RNA polymerase sigma factor (sigma-70 family)
MKNGDLVAEHFSYIRTGVKLRAKGLPWQVDRDDIVGCVYVRIVKDVSRYDRALGTFKTWLRGRMAGAVGDALRALTVGTRTYPVIERQLKRPDLLIDEAKAPNSAAHLIAETMAELPERWRDCLMMRFQEDCSMNEIASAFGVSEGRASQILERALREMKAILRKRGVRKVGDVI